MPMDYRSTFGAFRQAIAGNNPFEYQTDALYRRPESFRELPKERRRGINSQALAALASAIGGAPRGYLGSAIAQGSLGFHQVRDAGYRSYLDEIDELTSRRERIQSSQEQRQYLQGLQAQREQEAAQDQIEAQSASEVLQQSLASLADPELLEIVAPQVDAAIKSGDASQVSRVQSYLTNLQTATLAEQRKRTRENQAAEAERGIYGRRGFDADTAALLSDPDTPAEIKSRLWKSRFPDSKDDRKAPTIREIDDPETGARRLVAFDQDTGQERWGYDMPPETPDLTPDEKLNRTLYDAQIKSLSDSYSWGGLLALREQKPEYAGLTLDEIFAKEIERVKKQFGPKERHEEQVINTEDPRLGVVMEDLLGFAGVQNAAELAGATDEELKQFFKVQGLLKPSDHETFIKVIRKIIESTRLRQGR